MILSFRQTDVNWKKEKDPAYPMNYYDGKQYKLINLPGLDYSKYGTERPKYTE